jgi:hypothetical protein
LFLVLFLFLVWFLVLILVLALACAPFLPRAWWCGLPLRPLSLAGMVGMTICSLGLLSVLLVVMRGRSWISTLLTTIEVDSRWSAEVLSVKPFGWGVI